MCEQAVNQIEEGNALRLDFHKLLKIAESGAEVVPTAVQNIDTREVILVAYVNDQALQATIETRIATFWSTSRNELWVKGKSSGETFTVLEIYVNCEQNSLLYVVRPERGGICHTRNRKGEPRNCYYRRIRWGTQDLENINP
ncbi:phosphoribosyl-AMP cyclohydrolase [candidate division KSB3 bacterium]|uniref:phosphoribosyl-AMP cyclohydrolase n=1 Tax=candidate division KSB3 bacterium TaxID=2044937 RepID=A0A2G6E379_9BACT|nr:MAG: phosphoribosyl-AMP cyclohydrolase [candidate division KSB3 bacterium]PIE29089.1 MAG: phosphoribosyl-AMP cyclohydrolase [candidate division KSB3 bacterium]